MLKKGEKKTQEHLRKIGKSLKGKPSGALGCKHSKEAIEKRRKILIGNKYFLGHKHSESTKKKLSKLHTGDKNGRMKGGNSGRIIKTVIFKRDNYTCQKCGINDKDILCVDHIIPKSVRKD